MPDVVFFHGFKYVPPKGSVLDSRYLVQPKPVLEEGTGNTKVDLSDKLDLVELTQSYADQCGVEFVMKQLRVGALLPEQVRDDGKHCGDASVLPEDQFAAHNLAAASFEKKAKLCAELGLDPDKATENDIKAAVEEIYNKIQAAKPKEEVKENE